jgi:hypothetical protein
MHTIKNIEYYIVIKENKFLSYQSGKMQFLNSKELARIFDNYEDAYRTAQNFDAGVEFFPLHTIKDAKQFILNIIEVLGANFNPDDDFYTYFYESEMCSDDVTYLDRLNANLIASIEKFKSFNIDIYEFCLNNLPQTPMQIEPTKEKPALEIKTVTTNLDYNFYLFCQLRQQFLPSEIEYDIQFNLDIENYNLFLNTFNDPKIDLYTCITNFFTFQPVENKPAVNTLESIEAKFNAINEEYIKKLNEVLVNLSECDEIENTNVISWISDDLDYISVNYFMNDADGDYMKECKLGYQISNADAIKILTVRINNTLGIEN